MEYLDEFKEFVNYCNQNGKYVGWGNPNSKILIVGKESAMEEPDESYNSNASMWDNHVSNDTIMELCHKVEQDVNVAKRWGVNTWSKYQRLKDYIYGSEGFHNRYVDFPTQIFTTEINDTPSLRTAQADKSGISSRKELFQVSSFIQSFPVIILACSNYIQNNDNIREIDKIFGVTYDGDDVGRFLFNKGNWFYTHHDASGRKLVIHTRQLSADVKDDMLKEMSKIIKKHLERYV